jgi:hypothetical protein
MSKAKIMIVPVKKVKGFLRKLKENLEEIFLIQGFDLVIPSNA